MKVYVRIDNRTINGFLILAYMLDRVACFMHSLWKIKQALEENNDMNKYRRSHSAVVVMENARNSVRLPAAAAKLLALVRARCLRIAVAGNLRHGHVCRHRQHGGCAVIRLFL